MQERSIPLQVVLTVLDAPEQIVPERKGRSVYQSEVIINDRSYLIRLIVEPDGKVVTLYRTSKIEKYGSKK